MVHVIVMSSAQASMVCVVYHADALQMWPSQVHYAKYSLIMLAPYFLPLFDGPCNSGEFGPRICGLLSASRICPPNGAIQGAPRGTSWVKIWAKSGDCHWLEPLADGLVGPDQDRTMAVMQRVYN
jgi:hypothetical protein